MRSKPYFFSFDSKSKPGKVIAHCVRIETIEIPLDETFDVTTFTLLGADYDTDKRVREMIASAKGFEPGT